MAGLSKCMLLKRLIDIAAAFAMLIVSLPIFGVVAAMIRLVDGSPVLFRHKRPGLHGKPFILLKFRTMTNERDSNGDLLPEPVRLTRLGRILRTGGLDELPQLWNVLKGEMSLVGPRPLLMQYLPLYTPEQMRRHDAKPGMTGWSQINTGENTDWETRFRYDVWYVDNWTVLLDVKILVKTAAKLFCGRHVSPTGNVTQPYFVGSDQRKSMGAEKGPGHVSR